MKRSKVVVPWQGGLHLRPATAVVRLARALRCSVVLKCNGRIAEARSLLSLLLLCAAMGTAIELEVSGEDEEHAIAAVESVFQNSAGAAPSDPPAAE
jgi:phosphotransferase system HPr (HPr) family protein